MERGVQRIVCLALTALAGAGGCDGRVVTAPKGARTVDIYSHNVTDLAGNPTPLSVWSGKVTLVVNLASECGYTPQYAGLQALQDSYQGEGFTVLGFPCNDFGSQEPGGRQEIEGCAARFGATFPIMGKVQVKPGEGQSPLYRELAEAVGEAPAWNFAKYLVDAKGRPVAFFGTKIDPNGPEVRGAIERLIRAE